MKSRCDLPLSGLCYRSQHNRRSELVSNDVLGAVRGSLPDPLEEINPRNLFEYIL